MLLAMQYAVYAGYWISSTFKLFIDYFQFLTTESKLTESSFHTAV